MICTCLGGAVLNRRSLSFALVLVSMMFLVIMPLNADDSLGWEGVSFGLKINKYQAAFYLFKAVNTGFQDSEKRRLRLSQGIIRIRQNPRARKPVG